MADAQGGSPVVVRRPVLLNPFLVFVERLSQEIEKNQLEGLKNLLHGDIPLGVLEECDKPRKLFNRMKQQGLLGENNLDFLEQLLQAVGRTDLAESVRGFKKQSNMEVECDSPGNITAQ